jgi:hypothetical protein
MGKFKIGTRLTAVLDKNRAANPMQMSLQSGFRA